MDRLHILVCENLRREAAAVIADGGYEDVAVSTFAAQCNGAQADWETLWRAAAGESQGQCVDLIGGPCCAGQGTGASPASCLRIHQVERCADLFVNRKVVDGYVTTGALPLLPGLLAQWREGIDGAADERDLSRARSLVLLDTGVDDSSPRLLSEIAARAGLPCSVTAVGLDFFGLFLSRIVLERRMEREKEKSAAALARVNRRSAGYAIVVDMIGSLTKVMTEAEAIEHIFDVFVALFAPERMSYTTWRHGQPERTQCRPEGAGEHGVTVCPQIESAEDVAWAEGENGFRLRICHQREMLGLLEIEGLAFPEYREHYLNLALAISDACGLAVSNARKYEEIQRIQELLDAEREQLAVTLHSIGDGVIATDTGARVVLMNEVAERLAGWTMAEAAGRHLDEVFRIVNETTRKPCESPVEKVLETGSVQGLANDTALIARDGGETMIADSAAPIRDAKGRVLGVVLVFRDVTEQKQAERFRERYLHTIGHDLRNPLTAILGTAQLLRHRLAQQGLEREVQGTEAIVRGAERMNSMVRDLVESARLESGQLELYKEPVDLLTLVKDIIDRTGTIADRGRIRIDAPAEPVPAVEADPQRLERAIVNLLTNGLKYSPGDKPVTIRIGWSVGHAAIRVVDQGDGIPAEELPGLFTPYHRGETGRRSEGLGLGLYITRLIVEAHGGRVGVESEAGKGSTFSLSLPLAQ